MQNIADFVNSTINNYRIDSSIIQSVQGCLGKEWKPNGWISLILSNRECVVLRFNNGVFMNQGFVVNEQKVLKVFGNHQIGAISYNEEQSIEVVEGIVDLDHGSRFEGLVLTENNFGIPFGYGEMYDDDGILVYKGIMINWKRFGYGTSYHNNGCIEYEGYWCDDNRFGIGKVYDRYGKLVNECEWYNGIECDIEEIYEGDGSKPLNIGMKHLKLIDYCVLVDWDVSLLYNLESIEIGNDCFGSVQTFKIDRLNRLKTIKIGDNSFTQKKNGWGIDESKSFHILNCKSLESIQIGEYSFSDYAGDFELKNLPQLQSIQIGTIGSQSWNFSYCSFVIRGIDMILNI
ncbi:uncharacterized protein [Blastocystis hominis]|uniref:Uncharacterized protein n=1 Tax=Blastocystis hominis TaxID=12968 RepID=D8M476_BLAHO|nr:uncharacterized protein [Blastocystis hominis]CBK22865.2 unnamed protein product [Blastocystis hominis]|eukprot:XP_012896913.1 uncharacterized protein [Blastocystis hominis]